MKEKPLMVDRGDPADRDRWARLRFAIIGPLLAAPPARGDLQTTLRTLASRSWQHPITGQPTRFGLSTIQRWFYTARARLDPVGALKTRVRTDAGRSRTLTPKLLEALHEQYRDHPGWSIKLHYDNLRALFGEQQVPSYGTVRRFMASQGLHKQRRVEASRQFAPREVRSFEVEHVNSCWHLDFHTGSRSVLTAKGTWVKPSALCILDDRSRLICHVQWFLDETARTLVHGFCQALMRRALPRSL
ncbi:MAG TPA: helix-turn-helix domain-containing protein, partial [Terracidiphilus sp.]